MLPARLITPVVALIINPLLLLNVPPDVPLIVGIVVPTAQNEFAEYVNVATGNGLTVMLNVVGAPLQIPLCEIKLPNECGAKPTPIFVVTTFVAVLITDTLFDPKFATNALLPSAVNEIPCGLLPTEIVPDTVFVAVLITETFPLN